VPPWYSHSQSRVFDWNYWEERQPM
jgi:hypothetical protein